MTTPFDEGNKTRYVLVKIIVKMYVHQVSLAVPQPVRSWRNVWIQVCQQTGDCVIKKTSGNMMADAERG